MKKNITIFNTLSGKKEEIKPIKPNKINIFVCGPTVYDYSHIGHARTYIIFDAFVKYLRFKGYNVFYLQNITDVDDKIIARAKEKGVSPEDLAIAFEKEYLKDMKTLGVDSISKYIRATDNIKQIIDQIKRLKNKGFAYEIERDGIYFDISKFKNYGKLAGRTVLQAEDSVSRIDYSKDKKNRGDFCLWKLTDYNSENSNEPYWPSIFGNGRPGWHIEDTALTEKIFGAQYDIHGGARDLIFPHHQAEIAQMEAVSGKSPLVRYWMHTGFLTVNNQKMGKSLGNFIVINDLLKRCAPNYLRFFIIKNLWRSPIDYSESAMIEVKSAVDKVEEFIRKLKDNKLKNKTAAPNKKIIKNFVDDFYNELDNDFNTPKAFAVMFDFINKINAFLDKNILSEKDSKIIYKIFQDINKIFGFINFDKVNQPTPLKIKKLAKLREGYRKQKEWEKADEVRQQIEKNGFIVQDSDSGPIIKKL